MDTIINPTSQMKELRPRECKAQSHIVNKGWHSDSNLGWLVITATMLYFSFIHSFHKYLLSICLGAGVYSSKWHRSLP